MAADAVPAVFALPRSLRALNVISVASALAAATSATFIALQDVPSWAWALQLGVPTFLVGTVWALLLRWEKRSRIRNIRWGWLASAPLAALNAALCGGLFLMTTTDTSHAASFAFGALIGATFGVVFWVPALVAVLVCFGLPIARAQRLAEAGLAGRERGERFLGLMSATIALAAALAADGVHPSRHPDSPVWGAAPLLGEVLFFVFALSAIATGVAAAVQSTLRESRRRRFIERVERGEEPHFRVEPTTLGKVLLRVAPAANYRVADRAEEIFELDEVGRATRRAAGG